MRIKRTFAPTMREALALVKQEQGADAVILGNKKVPGGVEIISAIDYDEAAVNGTPTNVAQTNVSEIRPIGNNPDTPAYLNKQISNSQNNINLASDTWVGPLVTDQQNGRREPILGPVAGIPAKKVVTPAKAPAWLEQAFERAEKMPISKQIIPNSQKEPRLQPGVQPVGINPVQTQTKTIESALAAQKR